jgi:hypothetical protein
MNTHYDRRCAAVRMARIKPLAVGDLVQPTGVSAGHTVDLRLQQFTHGKAILKK